MTKHDTKIVKWYRRCLTQYKKEVEEMEAKLKAILDKYNINPYETHRNTGLPQNTTGDRRL